MTVARVWAERRLRPHRLERYMASNDPQFEAKAADIIGLYLNPPQHAAVFCVDEKTAIQALIVKIWCCRSPRAEPSVTALSTTVMARFRFLPLSTPARAMSWAKPLSATLRRSSWPFSLTSWPINPSVKRSTSSPNLSAHKTSKVEEFLARHPNVHLQFTPMYTSCLNQEELWFAKVQRDVIARGIFTSIKDLDKKLMRYIRQYNQKPKTVKSKYFDPTSRITCQSTVTAH